MRFGIRTTFAIAFAALAAWLTFSIPEPGRAQRSGWRQRR